MEQAIDILSSERAHKPSPVAPARERGNLEIGRGFRDSMDEEINPVDGAESEQSSIYIPRECKKLIAPGEKSPPALYKSPAVESSDSPAALQDLVRKLEAKEFLTSI